MSLLLCGIWKDLKFFEPARQEFLVPLMSIASRKGFLHTLLDNGSWHFFDGNCTNEILSDNNELTEEIILV